MKVIGLCGPEGAGKTTAAQALADLGFCVVPFAKPLKDMLRALGVPERHLTGTPADKAEPLAMLGGKSARHAMQTLGTQWGREHIASDFWARAWLVAVRFQMRDSARRMTAAPDTRGIVADDVRFPQEVNAIKKLGGRVICIVRSEADYYRTPKHASENFAALVPDMVIENDGDVASLRGKLIEAMALFRRDAAE